MNTSNLLIQAQELHIKNPADPAHDWIHHCSVLSNALEIVGSEKLAVTIEILSAACLFHDFDRGNEKHQKNAKEIIETTLTKEFANSALEVINEHSFGNKQTSIESKVLYDADKLAYLNLLRHYELNAHKNLNKERTELYNKCKKALEERLDLVFESLHFEYTKRRFRVRMEILKNVTEMGYLIPLTS